MAILKYKDPETGEIKKVGMPQVDAYGKAEVYNRTEADAKFAEKTHASQHKAGGADPLTPEDIGAARLYTNITQLGLTIGSETLETIFAAMPVNSTLRYTVTSAHNAAIYPYGYGIVEAKRPNASAYGEITFTATTKNSYFNRHWHGSMYFADDAWTFSGWDESATTDYAVNKAGDTMTGNLTVSKSSPYLYLKNTSTARTARMASTSDKYLSLYNEVTADASNNRTALWLGPETSSLTNLLSINHVVNGTANTYKVLHTGNSNKTKLVSTVTTPTVNNEINWVYE